MFLHLACLLALAQLSSCLVQFKQSTMYDITDFDGVTEVRLPHCDGGCLIYASGTEEGKAYMENMEVRDSANAPIYNIYSISQHYGDNSVKRPVELATPGNYSIYNLNVENAATPHDVAVYVIDRATGLALNYEIYDAGTMARPNVVPKPIITVMGAKPFVVTADKGASNAFAARLTGPDNAQENNSDSCPDAYKTNNFQGFEFHVDGPIVSIVFDKKNLLAIRANYDWLSVRNLSTAGFVSSPGYHGCAMVNPMQVYRQLNQVFSAEYDLKSDKKITSVLFDNRSNVTQEIVFKDMTNSQKSTLCGEHSDFQIMMHNTQYVNIYYNDVSPPYSFIARHTVFAN